MVHAACPCEDCRLAFCPLISRFIAVDLASVVLARFRTCSDRTSAKQQNEEQIFHQPTPLKLLLLIAGAILASRDEAVCSKQKVADRRWIIDGHCLDGYRLNNNWLHRNANWPNEQRSQNRTRIAATPAVAASFGDICPGDNK